MGMENTTENIDPSINDPCKKAKQIKQGIKSLEKELKALQENCNHPEYKIMNCPSENTTFALRKVCVKCDKEIGYPSQQETDDWVKA
jgi:hypothetical protein